MTSPFAVVSAAAFTAGALLLWGALLRTRVDRALGGRSWFVLAGACTLFAVASLRGILGDPFWAETGAPLLATAGAVGFLAGLEGLLRDAQRRFGRPAP
jgi:hypothetical protein